MLCPVCNSNKSRVVETRITSEYIRRRRECKLCQSRYTTYEKIAEPTILVIKRNGSIEKYSRDKITNGILTACRKRNISQEVIQEIVNSVEKEILKRKKKSIKSSEIGKLVLKHLKKVDIVAYIRFASVYLNFTDLDSFKKQIEKLEQKSHKTNYNSKKMFISIKG
ncbi:MAG: transcriptional regulator NrdR [Candidatus Micrarchaeota archaeon]|nr:transcriptional regulator NrdR [Candidatus Micrarchaeota archaeon]